MCGCSFLVERCLFSKKSFKAMLGESFSVIWHGVVDKVFVVIMAVSFNVEGFWIFVFSYFASF